MIYSSRLLKMYPTMTDVSSHTCVIHQLLRHRQTVARESGYPSAASVELDSNGFWEATDQAR